MIQPPEPPRALPGYEHIKRYWDHHHAGYIAKILPGEYYVTRHDEILTTRCSVRACPPACVTNAWGLAA